MWVSTAMVGWPKATFRTTLAVLRPTPGRASRAARSSDTSGQLARIAGVAQDITESKAAADQLADEKAKYLTLTELSADWDWELEPDFRIREISKQIPDLLRDWSDAITGHYFWDLTTVNIPWAGETQLAQKLANDARAANSNPPARRRNDKTPEQDARILPEHLQQAREMLLQDPHAGWKLLHATLQRGERIRDFEFSILTKGALFLRNRYNNLRSKQAAHVQKHKIE